VRGFHVRFVFAGVPTEPVSRRLVVVDHYDADVAFAAAADAANAGDAVDVLLLGIGAGWLRWRYPDRFGQLLACRLIDPAPIAADLDRAVGTAYVDLISRMPDARWGGSTLRQLLDDPVHGQAWWRLEISEKGPYRSRLLHQLRHLYVLRAALEDQTYDSVLYAVRDVALAGVITDSAAGRDWRPLLPRPQAAVFDRWPFHRFLLHALLAALRIVVAWGVCRRQSAPASGGLWIFTAFPDWWTRPNEENAEERFFGRVAEQNGARYLAWLTSPEDLWRRRHSFRAWCGTRQVAPLQRFLRWRDVAQLFAPGRVRPLWQFLRHSRDAVRADVAGFEAGPLVAQEVTRSLAGGESARSLMMQLATAGAVRTVSPAAILYRAEFQPAETAVIRGAGPTVATAGYAHFPFGENYLSIRFLPGEVSAHLEGAGGTQSRALPSRFLVNGAATAAHLHENGIPPERVRECGPVRYRALTRYVAPSDVRASLRHRLGLPPDRAVAVIALAIIESDTQALLSALLETTERASPDLHLLVRPHPNMPGGDDAMRTVLETLGGSRVSLFPRDLALYDGLAGSDVLVCVGSMIAFEAMALGVMPIVFENPATFCAVSLSEYDDGLFVARSPTALEHALRCVLERRQEAAVKSACWPSVLRRVMGPMDRDPEELLAASLRGLKAM